MGEGGKFRRAPSWRKKFKSKDGKGREGSTEENVELSPTASPANTTATTTSTTAGESFASQQQSPQRNRRAPDTSTLSRRPPENMRNY